MARGIVKLAENEYVEWGTITDSPVSYICDRAGAVKAWGEDRVKRADQRGHSWHDVPPMSAEDLMLGNRAGENESELTLDEVRAAFREELVGSEDGADA